jgi:hypothetical protein
MWIQHRRSFSLAAAVALTFPSAWAADPPAISAASSDDGRPAEMTLGAYRDLSASQSRHYDRTQDISPRQMLMLLEVSERTGANLGQALATGEMESAATWNDHVRPTLQNGRLGSATGVWQFQPATFHRILKRFGTQLLAASETAADRERLDLGDGPFTDATVRRLIQDTVDGKRGEGDEELQLLRHNFAVLAFAKHYLSLDSGATTPEEDYLYHFLGAGEGRRVLALARGEARDTLCVKPVEVPVPFPDTALALAADLGESAIVRAQTTRQTLPLANLEPTSRSTVTLQERRPVSLLRGLESRQMHMADTERRTTVTAGGTLATPTAILEPALFSSREFSIQPSISAEWGLPADSPTVTGNPGMFYRDGKGQSQPYTWAEFMEHLARRVRADRQPALVRAKYGAGFDLKGGDLPEQAFNPQQTSKAAEFFHENGATARLPETLLTSTLNQDETRRYRQRLAALISQGEDRPLETLPPETLSALQHLRLLPPGTDASQPAVRQALQRFRALVGKDAPDDPAQASRLMPAERIALELYARRLARYAALQTRQQAALGDAPDLNRIKKMPARARRSAAVHLATVQTALAEQGLLTPPTRKSVWRDKKRKKHVSHKTLPFAGAPDQATVAALDAFQWRQGLRKTGGVLDAVTLRLLGLPPLEPEIVLPLSGPQCVIVAEAAPLCALPTECQWSDLDDLIPPRPCSLQMN